MNNSARITRELRRIAKTNGGVLKPEAVLDAARPKASPLHSKFQWDDGLAAEGYRLWQARQLIRVCVEKIEGVSSPFEVFVSLPSDRYNGDGGGYRVTTDVLSDEDMRAEMLADALGELEVFRMKYKRLKELQEVFTAIQRVAGTARRGGSKRGGARKSKLPISTVQE